MKNLDSWLRVCRVSITLAVLAGCAGGNSQSTLPPMGATGPNAAGIGTKAFALASMDPSRTAKTKIPDLFVNDDINGAVEILKNKSWIKVGSITSGIALPSANWVDSKGNLYVANTKNATVTEYARGANSPTFTYSSGLTGPRGVTTDSHGNVYVTDNGAFVTEFAQGNNKQIAFCGLAGFPSGVAVDSKGDVFVNMYVPFNGNGAIEEIFAGFAACHGTFLGVTLAQPGGMVLDNHNHLVVCDLKAAAVDIINPPYSSISGTLGSGYNEPVSVSINKTNTQAYVSDPVVDEVHVVNYPFGAAITTLGTLNGLSEPNGAVDGENFNP